MENVNLCNKAGCVNYITSWAFGCLLHSYLGNNPLVLQREGENGDDLEIAITKEWVDANKISKFALTKEEAAAIILHLDECESPECVEIKKRYDEMHKFLSKGKLPGGDMIIWRSIFDPLRPGAPCYFSREKGLDFAKAIDAIKAPILRLLGEDKVLFSWP